MEAEIGFVEDEDAAVGDGIRQVQALSCAGRLAGIDDFDDEVGAVEFALGALDADALDVVMGLAQAGGIDQAERDAVNLDDFLNGVAGGAGGGADDGTLKAEEGIEQAAFANVWSA